MRYLLGIDQGGTKTAAAVMGEDGRILGSALVKGSYFPIFGVSPALDRMEEAAGLAVEQAGIRQEDISLLTAGVSGIDWPGEDKMMEEALREDKQLLEGTFSYDQGGQLPLIRKYGELLLEEYRENGIYIRAFVPVELYHNLEGKMMGC